MGQTQIILGGRHGRHVHILLVINILEAVKGLWPTLSSIIASISLIISFSLDISEINRAAKSVEIACQNIYFLEIMRAT